ncbi:MAG: enoyl-CoA hydratase/isomerase family protein [Bryobacterales bacterium]|nr:enoyl-CoA hydratase/isomerase family protein [Bryobacterales bacterium]
MDLTAQSEQAILYERIERDGMVWAEITLNRPDKGNALTMVMLTRLGELATEVAADREVRAVLMRARGRFFCTGGDIKAWGTMDPHEMARHWILPGIDVFQRIAALPQPVIAVISGHVFGGGLELAMAADLRVALRSAKFGVPEVSLGMLPGWNGTRRLAEMIGVTRARHMALLGLPITAEQALDWGLVTALAEDGETLEQQAEAWREKLCANAPAAMGLVKGLLETMHADLRHHHASAVAEAAGTEDCREGVRAFVEKRPPVFRNR